MLYNCIRSINLECKFTTNLSYKFAVMNFLVVLGLILSIMAVALVGMAVRMLLIKNGEVRGGCAGKNPMMQEEGLACTVCGAMPTEECKNDEEENLADM